MGTRLYSAAGWDEAWDAVVSDWLAGCLESAWSTGEPCVLSAPSPATLAYLKWRLLRSGSNGLLIHFWTPGRLREYLFNRCAPGSRLALREDLHLLMSAAAESVGDTLSARAIAADPDELVSGFDRLSAAGHGSDTLERSDWRSIAESYESLQQGSETWRAQRADGYLFETASGFGPVIGKLMLVGYSGSHWSSYFLLQAACRMARDAGACFVGHRESRPDQLWIGSWEEAFGAAEPVAVPGSDGPGGSRWSKLAEAMLIDRKRCGETGSQVIYHIGGDAAEEARAIFAQALAFLSDPECSRLGIILPSGSLLSREVGALFGENAIPHNDGFGYYSAQAGRQRLLNAWVAWQGEPRLSRAAAFLRLAGLEGLFSRAQVRDLERSFRAAFDTVLTDDWEVIREWLETRAGATEVRQFSATWPLLPRAGTVGRLIEVSSESLKRLGWDREVRELSGAVERFGAAIDGPIGCRPFLRWVHGILRTPGKTRVALGREVFAKVQILSWRDAAGQPFSHLILGGLNHGKWPSEATESPFLSDDLIESLNTRAVRTGSQGEGHLILSPGKGYLNSAADERAIAFEDFIATLETDPIAIAATASIAVDGIGNASGLVSEFLLRLFWADRGEMLDDSRRENLLDRTRRWLDGWANADSSEKTEHTTMVDAYRARRDPQRPFGEFDYGFREPPRDGLRLSCTAWEAALKRPASIWYERILKAVKPIRFSEPPAWNLAIGNWVHAWLRVPSGETAFTPRPDCDKWLRVVAHHADELARSAGGAYRAAGRDTPEWWHATWAEALTGARSLVRAVSDAREWPVIACEYRLPEGAHASVREILDLPVTGRVDLLLASAPLSDVGRLPTGQDTGALWVVDFKTGNDQPLSLKRLGDGNGLQLALYALALDRRGAGARAVSVLRLREELIQQLDVAEFDQLRNLWSGIQSIHRSGVLGQRGEIRSAYAFTGDYPIATLQVPTDILEAKWSITHPLLGVGG